MAKKNSKKKELKVAKELLSQLLIRANNWGLREHFSPLKLEEMQLDSFRKLIGDLLTEKANLEYELHSIGTDKQEALIKIERLNAYILKAKSLEKDQVEKIKKMLGKNIGDRDKLALAINCIGKKSKVSVLVGGN